MEEKLAEASYNILLNEIQKYLMFEDTRKVDNLVDKLRINFILIILFLC